MKNSLGDKFEEGKSTDFLGGFHTVYKGSLVGGIEIFKSKCGKKKSSVNWKN